MKDKIIGLKEEVESFITDNKEKLEEFRIRLLGKKGDIVLLFEDFKNVSSDQKKEIGQLLNELKINTLDKINSLKQKIEDTSGGSNTAIDLTLPAEPLNLGSRHPISVIRKQIIDIFSHLGYTVSDGPEIEDDWHNFSALNFPPNHPARDMQDTFFIEKDPDISLRTHTSSVQVRMMESHQPPIRTISPGRVYRNEAISARAHCFFHQVEGLYIDEGVSFADLKQTLLFFVKEMFGKDVKIRMRPSFFPFTEPSAEVDVSCFICNGKGCNICKYTGWVEILGCGMVHSHVLQNCKIDPAKYTGFAFGMGIERITMLKYQINDLRLFSENDQRFLNQFQSTI